MGGSSVVTSVGESVFGNEVSRLPRDVDCHILKRQDTGCPGETVCLHQLTPMVILCSSRQVGPNGGYTLRLHTSRRILQIPWRKA